MKKLLQIALILLLAYNTSAQSQQCFEPHCSCDSTRQKLTCANFTSFAQLNFSTNTYEWNEITIRATTPGGIELNSDLDLTGLKLSTKIVPQITFENIRQFQTDLHLFKPLELSNQFNLAIVSSSWRFATSTCSISNTTTFAHKIFSSLNIKKLELRNINFITANSNFCPLIFFQTSIESFEIYSPIGRINYTPIQFTDFNADDLQIEIKQLFIYYGSDLFIRSITEDSLLNPYIFKSIKNLEVVATYLNNIDAHVFQKFTSLKQIKLLNIRLKNVIENSIEWLENLNSQSHFDFSTDLTQEFFQQNAFKLYLGDEIATLFQFNDNDLCYFAKFPHENLVIPLIESFLSVPCSCTVYSLYKNYLKYKKYLTPDELKSTPAQCLSITESQLNDQYEFCEQFNSISRCSNTPQSTLTTERASTNPPKSCVDASTKCTCDFTFSNYLQCSDSSIDEIPFQFKSDVEWDYVSFAGASIYKIDSFNDLKLAANATILIRNVTVFGTDIFASMQSNGKFRFIVQSSFLDSISRKPFTNTNFSSIEFNDCYMPFKIPFNAFEGSNVDLLSIKSPKSFGSTIQFTPTPLFYPTSVRKFKIYGFNPYYGEGIDVFFGVDSFLLPTRLFGEISELEISNTKLDFIDSIAFMNLKQMSSVRLESVSLGNAIKWDRENGLDEYENWLAYEHIKQVFLGRENRTNFTFQNEYLCYFRYMHDNLKIYLYDAVDTLRGPDCTCTLYLIYSKMNFSEIANDGYASYIPKCILALNNSANVNQKLNTCLGGLDVDSYCENQRTTTSTSTTMTTSKTTTSTTPTSTIKSTTTSTTLATTLKPTTIISSTITTISTSISSTPQSTPAITSMTTFMTTKSSDRSTTASVSVQNSSKLDAIANDKESVATGTFIIVIIQTVLIGLLVFGLIYLLFKLNQMKKLLVRVNDSASLVEMTQITPKNNLIDSVEPI